MRDENLQELSEEIPAKKEKQKRERKNKNGKKFLDKIIDMFFESISYEEYDI